MGSPIRLQRLNLDLIQFFLLFLSRDIFTFQSDAVSNVGYRQRCLCEISDFRYIIITFRKNAILKNIIEKLVANAFYNFDIGGNIIGQIKTDFCDLCPSKTYDEDTRFYETFDTILRTPKGRCIQLNLSFRGETLILLSYKKGKPYPTSSLLEIFMLLIKY